MRGLAAGAGARRLLSVACADEMLRVPRRLRSRLRLTQHALDAALAVSSHTTLHTIYSTAELAHLNIKINIKIFSVYDS